MCVVCSGEIGRGCVCAGPPMCTAFPWRFRSDPRVLRVRTHVGWNWDYVFDWTILKYQRSANGVERPLTSDPAAARPPAAQEVVEATGTARARRCGAGSPLAPLTLHTQTLKPHFKAKRHRICTTSPLTCFGWAPSNR